MEDKESVQGLTLDDIRAGEFVPGRNADSAALAIKRAHLRAPHVAPLNALADTVADAEGIERGLVPYVDPQLGGTGARVLALLDNPSTKAEAGTGSGLLSLENDDRTAKNCAAFYNDLGMGPELFVHWNVAPAPIEGQKNGHSSAAERERGAVWLKEIVDLLPNLKVVLLMGVHARDGWKRSGLAPRGLYIPDDVPHPSQQGLNNPGARVRFRAALEATKDVLDGKACPQRTSMPGNASSARVAPRQASRSTPARTPTIASGTWAWWPTFEHYCAPESTPWAVSTELSRIERAIDRHDGPPKKWSVIARRSGAGWTLTYRRKDRFSKELADYQVAKYDAARAGGSRGNLGPVPPAAQLHVHTQDLDAWA